MGARLFLVLFICTLEHQLCHFGKDWDLIPVCIKASYDYFR